MAANTRWLYVCVGVCVTHKPATSPTPQVWLYSAGSESERTHAHACTHNLPHNMCTSSQPAHFEQSPNHRPKSQTLPVFTQKIPANLYHVLTSLCCHLHCFSGVFFGFLVDEDKASKM